ncbi:hypothetical protein EVA_18369 [gut metagenome]|uniref:Uncharacterized protein n=1 Tax=gut metagenome TaxID=749906 RepID=J9G1V2_9ZZZZ
MRTGAAKSTLPILTLHGSALKMSATTVCSGPSCPRGLPLNPSLQSTSYLLLMS